MNRREGLKKSGEISVDWHSYFENYKKGRHYSIDTSESKNWREYFKHQEETISIKNPVLNSADDISDEIIDNIIHNKIDTLTINYEFTKRKGESFDQQKYYEEVLKIMIDHNWNGYLLSEYEGSDKYDQGYEVGQTLRKQHIMMKRILGD